MILDLDNPPPEARPYVELYERTVKERNDLRAQLSTATQRAREQEAELEKLRTCGVCPNCGHTRRIDEDGCCGTCGRDCILIENDRVVRPLEDGIDPSEHSRLREQCRELTSQRDAASQQHAADMARLSAQANIHQSLVKQRHEAERERDAARVECERMRTETLQLSECIPEDGFWRPCSGCHESNEGHPTGPYCEAIRCHLGSGCHECGGLGATWEQLEMCCPRFTWGDGTHDLYCHAHVAREQERKP